MYQEKPGHCCLRFYTSRKYAKRLTAFRLIQIFAILTNAPNQTKR